MAEIPRTTRKYISYLQTFGTIRSRAAAAKTAMQWYTSPNMIPTFKFTSNTLYFEMTSPSPSILEMYEKGKGRSEIDVWVNCDGKIIAAGNDIPLPMTKQVTKEAEKWGLEFEPLTEIVDNELLTLLDGASKRNIYVASGYYEGDFVPLNYVNINHGTASIPLASMIYDYKDDILKLISEGFSTHIVILSFLFGCCSFQKTLDVGEKLKHAPETIVTDIHNILSLKGL